MEEKLTFENVKKNILKKAKLSGIFLSDKAKELVPKDTGHLRNSIRYDVKEKGNSIIISIGTNVGYGQTMEYGCEPLNEAQLKADEDGLKDWARRKGVPYLAVKKSLMRYGIRVGTPQSPMKTQSGFRPWLRPALLRNHKKAMEMMQ